MRRAAFALIALAILSACSGEEPLAYGYVEGEFRRVAPIEAGPIAEIAVSEGDHVEAGDILFVLDHAREDAAAAEAEARADAARARLADARAGGRAEEIEAARELLTQAEATQARAQEDLTRGRELFERRVMPRAQLDALQAEADVAAGRVAEMRARLAVTELPARENAIAALEADAAAAEAGLAAARRRLADRTVRASAPARIDEVLRRPGEMAGPTAPVITLLPDGATRIRFFAREENINALAPGVGVALTCDGCASNLSATVISRAQEPEFTPPIIYSNEERARLVYRVDARPVGDAEALPVGLPVAVHALEANG